MEIREVGAEERIMERSSESSERASERERFITGRGGRKRGRLELEWEISPQAELVALLPLTVVCASPHSPFSFHEEGRLEPVCFFRMCSTRTLPLGVGPVSFSLGSLDDEVLERLEE